MPKVLTLLVNRANYGRLRPVMFAIAETEGLDLMVACTGTMSLRKYKEPINEVIFDGFPIVANFSCEVVGDQPKSTLLAGLAFRDVLDRVKPDCLLVIGDRFETVGCVLAASQANIPICHLQGGEVSRTRDDVARRMISAAADWHVPATIQSEIRLKNAGAKDILANGCPTADLVDEYAFDLTYDRSEGENCILAAYHPQTDHPGTASAEGTHFCQSLVRLANEGYKIDLLWPNIDQGSEEIADCVRWIRHEDNIHVRAHFPNFQFQRKLWAAEVAIGNSSAFVRDSSFYGTPVVLVGDRQDGREHASNVVRARCDANDIYDQAKLQMLKGRSPKSDLYGQPGVSKMIAQGLHRRLVPVKEVASVQS